MSISTSTKHKKIIIISPAFPYRGGIAATTDRLAKEYTSRGETVEVWTYKVLYPKLIFPGKSQLLDLTKHKAPSNLTIHRKIVSFNPLNWYKVGKELKKENPSKIILRYWLPFLGPCLGTIARIAKKNKNTVAIGLIDNVKPHESRFGDKILSNLFYKQLDGFLVMSKKGVKELEHDFEITKPIVYTPHPIFDIYGTKLDKVEAIKHLGLSEDFKYILSFGLIRKYKGVDLLIKAFKQFNKTNPNYKLLVVGECYENWDTYQDLIKTLKLEHEIIRFDQFVPDNEVKYYFSAAEFLALTYRSATQSGVTQISYSMELPMLVTKVGDLATMVPHGKVGLVSGVSNEEIEMSLNEMANPQQLEKFREGIKEEKKRFQWSVLCDKLDQL